MVRQVGKRAGGDAITPRRVAMLAYPGANALDIIGPLQVFSAAAARLAGRLRSEAYRVEILASEAGPVATMAGIDIVAHRSYRRASAGIDTLMVAGGEARDAMADTELLAWLRTMRPRVRRLASVCTGAFLLAAAGLLDGRRATTHWAWVDALRSAFPAVDVEPDALFVRDGSIYSSAGVTAGMDLALALVEEDHGHALALAVARDLVLFLKRPGGQSQFSSHLAAQAAPQGALKGLPEWIVEHLAAELSVDALARQVAMSPRNFARVFLRTTGMTPAKFVEKARVDGARRMLEERELPVESVARECGFGSAERLRRAFRRQLRVLPQAYRERFVGVSLAAAGGGRR